MALPGPPSAGWPRRHVSRYAYLVMAQQIEPSRPNHPIARRAVAGLILAAVALLVFHIVAGLVVAVFWIVAVIAVIAAVIWAARELF